MLKLGGAIVSVLDRSGREDVRLHHPCCANASAFGLQDHHRHHAVVLMELSLDTQLDQSSRDVIELNVCRTRRCRASVIDRSDHEDV